VKLADLADLSRIEDPKVVAALKELIKAIAAREKPPVEDKGPF
jgi:hypothetical protein